MSHLETMDYRERFHPIVFRCKTMIDRFFLLSYVTMNKDSQRREIGLLFYSKTGLIQY